MEWPKKWCVKLFFLTTEQLRYIPLAHIVIGALLGWIMCAYIAYKSQKWVVKEVLKKVREVKEHGVPHTSAEVKSNLKSVMAKMKLYQWSYQSVDNASGADITVSMRRTHIGSCSDTCRICSLGRSLRYKVLLMLVNQASKWNPKWYQLSYWWLMVVVVYLLPLIPKLKM